MKKLIAFLLAAAMMLCFAGCDTTSNPKDTESKGQTGSKEPVQDSFSFTYRNTKIALHAPAADVLAGLGDDYAYSQSASCAFEGLDKVYDYGSLCLQTYPIGQKDYIYGWWFEDDLDEEAVTAEGIRIGSSQEDVEAAYGADAFNGKNTYEVTKGSGKLTVIVKDNKVSSVQYAVITD